MPGNSYELVFKIQTTGQKELDRVAGAVSRIGSEVKSQLPGVTGLEAQFRKVSSEANNTSAALSGVGASVRRSLQDPIGAATASIEGLLAGFGKVGIVGAALGIGLGFIGKKAFDLVSAFGTAAEEAVNLADRLGISVREAEQLHAAAHIANVNIGVLESSTRLLAEALSDTAGGGEKTSRALERLGISTTTATGGQREMGAVLLEALSRLSQVENTADRVRLANESLGRAAKELLPLIKNYKELRAAVASLGVGLDEDLTRRLAGLDDQIDKLEIAWGQFKKSLAGKIAPIVLPVVVSMTESLSGKKGQPTKGPPQGQLSSGEGMGRAVNIGGILRALAGQRGDGGGRGAIVSGDIAALRAWDAASELDTSSILSSSISAATRPALDAANAQIRADLDRGKKLAAAFKLARASTDDALKKRLEVVKGQLAELDTVLSGDLGASAFGRKKAEFDQLTVEAAKIEAQIKAASERQSLIARLPDMVKQSRQAGLTALERLNDEHLALIEKLGPGFDKRVADIFRNMRQVEIQKIITDGRKQLANTVKESEQEANKLLEWSAKQFSERLGKGVEEDLRAVQSLSATLDVFANAERDRLTRRAGLAIRAGELTAAPGGEQAAAEQVYRIRLQLAEDLYQAAKRQSDLEVDAAQRNLELTTARAQYEQNIDEARIDNELKLLEIRRKYLDEYRETAGRVFDALTARGGGGLRDFLGGQLKILERQIFVNASAGIFQMAGGALGKIGAASGLGGLLSGTIFDPKNAAPVDRNTASLNRNRTSLDKLTGVIAGFGIPGQAFSGSGPGGLIFGDLPLNSGLAGTNNRRLMGLLGITPSGGSTQRGAFQQFLGGLSAPLGGNPLGAIFSPSGTSVQTGPGRATTYTGAERVGAAVGTGATVAAGTLGVIGGIRQGGARGTTQAIGSAAATAAALDQEPVSKAVLTAVAFGASLVSALLGDPKQERDEAIAMALQRARFQDPTTINRFADLSGVELDYDYRGRLRPIERPLVVNISAMDAKSFMDRRVDIADAVNAAVRGGGHPMLDTMKEVVIGA